MRLEEPSSCQAQNLLTDVLFLTHVEQFNCIRNLPFNVSENKVLVPIYQGHKGQEMNFIPPHFSYK